MSAVCIAARSLLFACAVLAGSNCAWAQGGPLQQGGAITPGHIPVFQANGVVGDGGSAQNGNVKEIGINNSGTPLCVTDAPTTGPYHQLCFGANSLGGGLVSFQAYNGAPVTSLMCNINGVQTPCQLSASNVQNLPGPLTVAGNISTSGEVQAENLRSYGDSYIGGTLFANGAVNAENLRSYGDSYVGHTLFVTADTSIGGALQASGAATIDGTLDANGGLDVSGAVPGSSGAALYVNGLTQVAGDLNVSNTLRVRGIDSEIDGGLLVSLAPGATVALQTNGNLEVNGTAYANAWLINSDAKLKTDIKDFKTGLAALQKLHPVSFHFVSGGTRQVGLIADEVQQVLPLAVKDRKAIDPMALLDVLIVANRELAERLEALEKKVGAAH